MLNNKAILSGRILKGLRIAPLSVLAALVLTSGNQPRAIGNQPNLSNPADQQRLVTSYGELPLSFEGNRGQTSSQVKFLSRGSGYALFLTGDEAVLALRGAQKPKVESGKPAPTVVPKGPDSEARASSVVRMKLLGANRGAEVTGLEELPGKSNYFIGNDPKKWRADVPTYVKVRYQGIYPGIDLVYYGNQRQLEYDFVVAPGADPKAIELAVTATSTRDGRGSPPRPAIGPQKSPVRTAGLRIDINGDLVVQAEGGEVRFHKPVVYQPARRSKAPAPERQMVDGRYVLLAGNRVTFEVANYDHAKPLVIDPVLVYSTYLGGSQFDSGLGVAVDSAQNVYVTGRTASPDFPTSTNLQRTLGGGDGDAFVTKINAAGTALVYSTYLGGSGFDEGDAIAVDARGNAYVTGQTGSTDFPTVHAIQAAFGGSSDAFVAKLGPRGNFMIYSTYLGGSGRDQGSGIAVDSFGDAYVTGLTASTNFATSHPIQAANGGGSFDAFVAKLGPRGRILLYSTYLGGDGDDEGNGIAVDSSGNAYVTGLTTSTNFPTANPIQPAGGGSLDAFVTKLNAAGDALVYSTYLGGSGVDVGNSIALDSAGRVYLTGSTASTDFPTTANAFQTTSSLSNRAFVTKFSAAGDALLYSTYLGGTGFDEGRGIAVDSSGDAYVTGNTDSTDFPTVNPVQATLAGPPDAFVTKLNPQGGALVYSTYLGGSDEDVVRGIAVDSLGNAYVTGFTFSGNFPTVHPIQTGHGGEPDSDVFVAKIAGDPPPAAVRPGLLILK